VSQGFDQLGGDTTLHNDARLTVNWFRQAGGDTTVLSSAQLKMTDRMSDGNSLLLSGGRFFLEGGLVDFGGYQSQIAAGAVLSGYGSMIEAQLFNNGRIDIGGANSVGTLTILGRLLNEDDGILNFDIGGEAPTEIDRLVINGSFSTVFTFGGTLNITLLNGYVPPLAQPIELIAFNSSGGSFSAVTPNSGNPLDGYLFFEPVYESNRFLVFANTTD
jgi:hypothetical protein